MAFDLPIEFQEAFLEELSHMSDEDFQALLDEVNVEVADGHLVEFVEACVKETTDHEEKRLSLDRQLIAAYENDMPELRQKEPWQTKITLPGIWTTCFQAKALVEKAVADRSDYFEFEAHDEKDIPSVQKAKFWKDALNYWGRRARFHQLYPDMTEMGFVAGISQAIKCVFHMKPDGPDDLKIIKINNEKIYRDPDAIPRDAQSGLYCIHEEWVDYHELILGQQQGRYINIGPELISDEDEYGPTRRRENETGSNPRRRNMMNRNRFRKSVRVREYWGSILDHNGELVMSDVFFTVANQSVIRRPEKVLFPNLKWPIHQFAPIPHYERFHGISLVEGVLKLWKLRNNLLCMATDKLSFALNDMFEVDPSLLQNPSDVEVYPGALKFRRPHKTGNAYQRIELSAKLEEMAPLWEMTGTEMQNGSFVTDLIRGTFGAGDKNVTATEQRIKYSQGLGVFESIGRNVEGGGVDAIKMIQEFLLVAWSPEDHQTFAPFLNRHPEVTMLIQSVSPEERIKALDVEADVSIRGVSLMLEKHELLMQLKDMAIITDSPRFNMYAKDDKIIEKMADAMNMSDLIKDDDELEAEMMAKEQTIAQAGGMPGEGMPMDGGGQPMPMPEGMEPPGPQGPPMMGAGAL